MTTLDMEPYLRALGDVQKATSAAMMFAFSIVMIGALVYVFSRVLVTMRGTKEHSTGKVDVLVILSVWVAVATFVAVDTCPKAVQRMTTTWPSFAEYVESAYGLNSTDLPMSNPGNGSLPVVWERGGEIHSGTLNLLDNKVSIKETNSDYLEVADGRAHQHA